MWHMHFSVEKIYRFHHIYSNSVDCLLPLVWVCACVCVCTCVSLFRFWLLQFIAEEYWYLVSLSHINREWTLSWFYFHPLMTQKNSDNTSNRIFGIGETVLNLGSEGLNFQPLPTCEISGKMFKCTKPQFLCM